MVETTSKLPTVQGNPQKRKEGEVRRSFFRLFSDFGFSSKRLLCDFQVTFTPKRRSRALRRRLSRPFSYDQTLFARYPSDPRSPSVS